MIIKVAWRNIWRNRSRSLVVIIAVVVGLWAGIFINAFYNGVINDRVNTVIGSEVSHIQIHDSIFKEEQIAKYDIPRGKVITDSLKHLASVKSVSARMVTQSMIASAKSSTGVVILGVSPKDEIATTGLDKKIIEGNLFEEGQKNQIIISSRLAEKLEVKLKSKIVLTFQDAKDDITAAAFRVCGLYKTVNSGYDELYVFVKQSDIKPLLGGEVNYHEIALLLNDQEEVMPLLHRLKKSYPHLLVESWMELSSGMGYVMEFMNTYLMIVMGIILMALMFGIVNVMLMAILERVHEIGMLMAVGMSKPKIFMMIMMETIFLTVAGTPIGLLISFVSITWVGNKGINLSIASEVYSQLGFSAIIYPELDFNSYLTVSLMVVCMAILAAIYPAFKALSLKPVVAIRNI